MLYGVHECTGGYTLTLDAESRFRAAAHLYEPEVVCGESARQAAKDKKLQEWYVRDENPSWKGPATFGEWKDEVNAEFGTTKRSLTKPWQHGSFPEV